MHPVLAQDATPRGVNRALLTDMATKGGKSVDFAALLLHSFVSP